MSTLVLEQEVIPHHSQLRDYLLVCDLPQRVRALRLAGLNVPETTDDCFLAIREEMSQRFVDLLPAGTQLRVIDMSELAKKLHQQAREIVVNLNDGIIVSTCAEVAESDQVKLFHINRLYDNSGQFIGYGPRPGCPSLRVQVAAIRSYAAGCPLVFIEDGTFTGGTICEIIRRFTDDHHISPSAKIGAVVLGFAFPGSLDRLYTQVPHRKVHLIEEVNQPVDWMPDHDFFPFIQNCGRVLGHVVEGEAHPIYHHLGASYATPYLTCYGAMAEWTGLNLKLSQLEELSEFFLASAWKIFRRICELNGHQEISFAELLHITPRVAIPHRINSKLEDKLPDSIQNVLRGEAHSVKNHGRSVTR